MPARKIRPLHTVLKTPTGITGLDAVCFGGLPRGLVTLVEGGPGAGKTLLALETLVHAARDLNEPGIFVAFEENSARIVTNAASFGWDLPALQRKKLFFLDSQPSFDLVQSGSFDLGGMLAALDSKIDATRAHHIVFDAIDVVLSLLDNLAQERRELYRLRDWISARGLTCIITSKTSHAGVGGQRGEFLQFMADCAITLDNCVEEGISQRTLRVLKYRGSRFHENATPYVIGSSGLEVAGVDGADQSTQMVTNERVSSGVVRIDSMLGGGFFRGAAILLSGAPGTAKTTLSGAFAQASCQRGEPTLFVSFDSTSVEIVRNLRSVGLRLDRFLGSRKTPGLLRMAHHLALSGSAETHLLEVESLARVHGARCVVIDPISALAHSGDHARAQSVAKRLMNWAKTQGITLFCTSLLDETALDNEGSPLHVSTIADTWIHLSYLARNGERNRCLSIIKSRGTAHSNQVRELLLSAQGITLADAYSAGGEVLLGTLRWERERAEKADRQKAERAEKLSRLQLRAEEAELARNLVVTQLQLDAKRAELTTLTESEVRRREAATGDRKGTLALRDADSEPERALAK